MDRVVKVCVVALIALFVQFSEIRNISAQIPNSQSAARSKRIAVRRLGSVKEAKSDLQSETF